MDNPSATFPSRLERAVPSVVLGIRAVAGAGRFVRRRPRLLMATALIVLGCGILWVNNYYSPANQARRRIEELGGYTGGPTTAGKLLASLPAPLRRQLDGLFGTRVVTGVVVEGKRATDSDVAAIVAAFPQIEQIDVSSTPVTDAALAEIGKLPALFSVAARHTSAGDAGVQHLARHSTLCFVELSGTRITDAALADLATVKRLNRLVVAGTGITDAGLAHLHGTPLIHLNVSDTQVTDAGIAAFQAANPRCTVVR